MSTHIAWACGWLATFGLVGFVRADDFAKLAQTATASARVTISKEIREQALLRCRVQDVLVSESLTRYIDSLQSEYERIAGNRLQEPTCPR